MLCCSTPYAAAFPLLCHLLALGLPPRCCCLAVVLPPLPGLGLWSTRTASSRSWPTQRRPWTTCAWSCWCMTRYARGCSACRRHRMRAASRDCTLAKLRRHHFSELCRRASSPRRRFTSVSCSRSRAPDAGQSGNAPELLAAADLGHLSYPSFSTAAASNRSFAIEQATTPPREWRRLILTNQWGDPAKLSSQPCDRVDLLSRISTSSIIVVYLPPLPTPFR
jgi:hypothetical protein